MGRLTFRVGGAPQQIKIVIEGRERYAQIVNHRRNEAPQRLHALALVGQFGSSLFQQPAVRNLPADPDYASDRAVIMSQRHFGSKHSFLMSSSINCSPFQIEQRLTGSNDSQVIVMKLRRQFRWEYIEGGQTYQRIRFDMCRLRV